MNDKPRNPDVVAALQVVDQIRPLLVGHRAAVQGAVLAQLLAYWIAGHPEEVREGVLADHLVGMHNMVEIILKEMMKDD